MCSARSHGWSHAATIQAACGAQRWAAISPAAGPAKPGESGTRTIVDSDSGNTPEPSATVRRAPKAALKAEAAIPASGRPPTRRICFGEPMRELLPPINSPP